MSDDAGTLWLWRGREPDCTHEEQGGRLGGSCSLVATLRSAVSLSTHDLCTVPQQNKERELIAYEWYVAPFAKQAQSAKFVNFDTRVALMNNLCEKWVGE